ncbi:MAG TPA: hypothetical protein DDX39_06670 [Bacteroidales bacterium]|nr:MAG: hypothetical protein A2W98_11290 [Bacteroidetes bacterium GWF2_33_38]OFY76677.1 MAG: hypothetical protein A2265_08965 [Bacteroidetes bacterium RIFOXYA12_FULL_33_9]HBF88310.1 hypothetical protein [Bacteroidales bacterium]
MKEKLIIFLILLSTIVHAQDFDSIKVETKIIVDKTVLVIPFNTKVYNNDADEAIAKETGKTFEQILNYLRLAFDQHLIKSLSDTCHSISMLSSYTVSANEDLQMIYSVSNYVLSDAMDYKEGKTSLYLKSNLASEKKSKKHDTGSRKGEVVSTVANNEDKFLHVKFTDDNFIKNIAHQYQIDYLLFINEFEILGNYTNPYEVGKNEHTMLIKVHYSLYNASGKYLFGSFATTEYKAYINDITKISSEYFPLINSQIINNIPLKPEIK